MELGIVLDGTEPLRGIVRAVLGLDPTGAERASIVVPFTGWLGMIRAIATVVEIASGTAPHDG